MSTIHPSDRVDCLERAVELAMKAGGNRKVIEDLRKILAYSLMGTRP